MNGFELIPLFGNLTVTVIVCAVFFAAFLAALGYYLHTRTSSDATALDWIRRGLITLCLIAAALGPSTVSHTTSQAVNGTDVFFAVDVTGSMAVKDATYGSAASITRLDAAKKAVDDITARYSGASYSAISFGATASLDVPLTPDSTAIKNWSSALKPEPTSVSSGSSLDAPLDTLLRAMQQAHDANPNNLIALYLVTDGEQTSTAVRRTFTSLRAFVKAGAVIGTGSAHGGRVPLVEAQTGTGAQTGATDQWVTDPDTKQPAISKMDPENLKDMADEVSIDYLPLSAKTTGKDIQTKASRDYKILTTPQKRSVVTSLVWPFGIALFALLVWEAAVAITKQRRYL